LNKIIILFVFLYVDILAQSISRMQVHMSTFMTISADDRYIKQIEDAFEIIKDVEGSISSYINSSIIYKLNKNKKVKLDEYTYDALLLSKKYYEKTDGFFDVTVGSITKDIYKFGEKEYLASDEELSNAKIGFNYLKFDNKNAYMQTGMKVDLGGMGKGFAVDKVAQYFRNNDIKKATISASGDIRCLDICSIDIQDPFKDATLLSFKTTKTDLAISTSGTYNRYIKSQKNNHLINPKEKKSQTKFISITLVGDMLNADLDAYTTASSVMPIDKAYKFLNSLDVAYIIVQSDSSIKIGGNINLIKSDAIKK